MGLRLASNRPSSLFGLRLAFRLWRLVLASWVAQFICVLPVLVVLDRSLGQALNRLPRDLADGDLLLVVLESLVDVRGSLLAAGFAAVIAVWGWTILRTAAVVSWRIWSEESSPRLTTLAGLGLARLFPFFRLTLVVVLIQGLVQVALWLPLSHAIRGAYRAMAEARMETFIWTGVVVAPFLVLVVWAASLRAAWLLGRPDCNSAVMAMLRSLLETIRHPFIPLLTVFVWLCIGWVVNLMPLLVGIAVPFLRLGPASTLLAMMTGLLSVACSVALLGSFAPTSGMVAVVRSPDGRGPISPADRLFQGQSTSATE